MESLEPKIINNNLRDQINTLVKAGKKIRNIGQNY